MTSLVVNPRQIPPISELPPIVRAWLEGELFADSLLEAFLSKWESLTDSARVIVAALISEGGKEVKESAIRQALRKRFGFEPNAAAIQYQESKLALLNSGLVRLISNTHSGDEVSLHPTWEHYLRRTVTNWLRERER
jgi:hypothetical protein